MPFDNRVVILDMSGADLRRIVTREAQKIDRRAGFSGMQVFVDCKVRPPAVRMLLDDGREISDDDRLRNSTNDFRATLDDGILSPGSLEGGYRYGGVPPRDIHLIGSLVPGLPEDNAQSRAGGGRRAGCLAQRMLE